jgi:two-component system, NtrC family, sensor histidine kinase HydH
MSAPLPSILAPASSAGSKTRIEELAKQPDVSSRGVDLLWLAFIAGLGLLQPVHEIHKQLILLAIGLFQIFDVRLLGSIPAPRRSVYSLIIKIQLATMLLSHTGTIAIASSYYLIYYVPIISAATIYGIRGTLFWTAIASVTYCSYLIPALREYQFTSEGASELGIRILFFFVVAVVVNRLASSARRQSESYRTLAETLAETNRRLEEAQAEVRRSERLAALGQLSAGVAHEIRNPLGVIRGSAEMLAQKLSPSDALAAELAGYISSEVDRLNGIVSRFLDFARPTQLVRRPAEILPILERALKSVRNGRPESHVQVETQYDPGLPLVAVDADLCEQVFANLTTNAYQAMGQGGGKLRVSAKAANSDHKPGIEIEFQDEGPGVPPELREQIFNPFFTTKREGVGLGLSIVSKIIDEHGGSIYLVDKPGKGACFRVFLPCG